MKKRGWLLVCSWCLDRCGLCLWACLCKYTVLACFTNALQFTSPTQNFTLRSHPAAISKQMSVVFKQGPSWRIRPKRALITTDTTPVWTRYDLKTPTRIQTPSTSLPYGLHFSCPEVWGLSHVWFSSWRNTWLSRAKAGFIPLTYSSIIHTSLVICFTVETGLSSAFSVL